jgi:hypothetical protein
MILKMMKHNITTCLGLTLATTLGVGGCGDPGAPGTLALHPVSGTVVLGDGKPLTSGRVVLVSRERAMEFAGKLGPEGSFQIGSNLGDGAPEGPYRVRIEPDATSLPQTKQKSAPRRWRRPFAARFSDEETSGLSATVAPGENRLEPFHLTSPGRGSAGQGKG